MKKKLGSKDSPFLVTPLMQEERFQQEKNRRMSQMLEKICSQDVSKQVNFPDKAILVLKELSRASLDRFVKGAWLQSWIDRFKIACRWDFPLDELAEIKSALGLPEDTSEPVAGVIWRLQQRVEEVEESLRLLSKAWEREGRKREVRPICGETLGDFICDEDKGHEGHHVGIRRTDHRISWPNNLAGLPSVDEKEEPQFCEEGFGNVHCDRIKGHIGHHSGICRTDSDHRVEWRYDDLPDPIYKMVED